MPYIADPDKAVLPAMEDTLGGRLAHARDDAGMSLEKLARAVNMHPATINYWEADRAAPSAESLEALAKALNVSTLWLKTGFGNGPDEIRIEPMPIPAFSKRNRRKPPRLPKPTGE